MSKTIGILGGLGPQSTGDFYLRFIASFQKKFQPKNNAEYPHIIINSIPAPELIYNQVTDDILQHYIHGLRELASNHVDIIAMICNTAHAFFPILQSAIDTPIVNLPLELEKRLKQMGVKNTLLLATPTAYAHGLYTYEGIHNLHLDKQTITELEKAIAMFNLGVEQDRQIATVRAICQAHQHNSEMIILGCTEVSLMLRNAGFQTIDPLDVLIDVLIEQYD